MKRALLFAATLALTGSAFAATTSSSSHSVDTKKLSYTMGYETGTAFKVHQINVDVKQFTKGLQASLKGTKPALTKQQMDKVMANFQRANEEAQGKHQMQEAKVDAEAGKVFLADNAKKPGVVTTKSGLQYKILKKGTGPKPKLTSKVTVDYEGRLVNGKVFDSSYARHQPSTFPVNGVIPGWTEGLQLMHQGATWMLYIPANLAYGKRGAGPMVGPNSVLIFKVHLIKVD